MSSLLILSLVLTQAAAGLVLVEEVEVEVGDTATLRCSDSRTPIRAVEWIKEDQPPKNILFYSDGHYRLHRQHSTFKGRVELVDLQHKGGDLSLRLKKVVLSDTGTYKCLVAAGASRRSKRALIDDEPVRTIQLVVRGSANDNSINGNTVNNNTVNEPLLHSIVVLVAGSLLLLGVVGVVVFGRLVYKRHLVKRSDEDGVVNDQFIKHSVEQQKPDSPA